MNHSASLNDFPPVAGGDVGAGLCRAAALDEVSPAVGDDTGGGAGLYLAAALDDGSPVFSGDTGGGAGLYRAPALDEASLVVGGDVGGGFSGEKGREKDTLRAGVPEKGAAEVRSLSVETFLLKRELGAAGGLKPPC